MSCWRRLGLGWKLFLSKIPALPLPAGQAVALKPGGYHLMLIKLNKTLKAGDKVRFAAEKAGGLFDEAGRRRPAGGRQTGGGFRCGGAASGDCAGDFKKWNPDS